MLYSMGSQKVEHSLAIEQQHKQIYTVVQQKLARHCKAVALQLKKKKKKKQASKKKDDHVGSEQRPD